jgi:hypothetical protein
MDHITQLSSARPSEGEKFYIQVLLQNQTARSFDECKTVNGNVSESFQHAAIALGLYADEREAEYALLEAVNCHLYTPHQLQQLFVDILINECSNSPLKLWDIFKDNLCIC